MSQAAVTSSLNSIRSNGYPFLGVLTQDNASVRLPQVSLTVAARGWWLVGEPGVYGTITVLQNEVAAIICDESGIRKEAIDMSPKILSSVMEQYHFGGAVPPIPAVGEAKAWYLAGTQCRVRPGAEGEDVVVEEREIAALLWNGTYWQKHVIMTLSELGLLNNKADKSAVENLESRVDAVEDALYGV